MMPTRLTVAAILAAGLLLGCGSVAARAHSYVTRSQPANGSVATPPPTSIRLVFDRPIEARYAKVAILHEGKPLADVPPPTVDPAGIEITQPLPSPQPGHYTVNWDVVGRDGHRTNGTLGFDAR